MRHPYLLSILVLASCAACGDRFSVPTDPGSVSGVQTNSGNPGGSSNPNNAGSCSRGSDPQCPALEGLVQNVNFDVTVSAGFESCQDGNAGVSFTRVLVTDSTAPCDGAFVGGSSGAAVLNGTRVAIVDITPNGTVRDIGVYASDANGLLVPVGNNNTVGDANTVDNPNNPNTTANPNVVMNPNALHANAVFTAPTAPEALNALQFHIDSGSPDGSLPGNFQASDAAGQVLSGSFKATLCRSAVSLCTSP